MYDHSPLEPSLTAQADKNRPLSVTELNARARRMLETQFGNIRVEGEISGLARPGSGHWYFTLKDAGAQIRCAMFKHKNKALKFIPAEGMQLQLRGRVSLYEGRGDYQLIVEHMEEAGAGALQRAFEELKQRLATEGLFNAERKRKLPTLPQHIGVITSPTGAAIKDILAVLKRRFPSIPVTVIPSLVQGNEAAAQIARNIELANQYNQFDVLIVGRGGGSLEDLWPFNEEVVARAIVNSATPIVSAVGHEIDFTISDFVADYRAPTPSAAAEILSPDREEYLSRVNFLNRKLNTQMQHRLQYCSQALDHLNLRLRHPGEKLREHHQRLQDLNIRLMQAATLKTERSKSDLQQLSNALRQHSPERKVEQLKVRNNHYQERLIQLIQQSLERKENRLQHLGGQLNTVSPLATLSRGYSITQKGESVVRKSSELHPGDKITAKFSSGSADCQVISVNHP